MHSTASNGSAFLRAIERQIQLRLHGVKQVSYPFRFKAGNSHNPIELLTGSVKSTNVRCVAGQCVMKLQFGPSSSQSIPEPRPFQWKSDAQPIETMDAPIIVLFILSVKLFLASLHSCNSPRSNPSNLPLLHISTSSR